VDLERLFAGMDAVIHLAAITNAEVSFALRDQVEATNFEGTRRVAEACVRCGCKLVFVSTTSVYGPQGNVVDEDCVEEDLRPQSPYADNKLRAEQILKQYGQDNGLRFIICRFGTIFGPSMGMRFDTAVNKFIFQACMGLPMTVWRTALHQMRPYLDLADAVAALNFIIENDLFDNRIYNVLTLNATVNDILQQIACYISDLKIEQVDSPIMNQLSYTVSNQRFKDLGFNYTGSLQKGIGDTIELLQGIICAETNVKGEGVYTLNPPVVATVS